MKYNWKIVTTEGEIKGKGYEEEREAYEEMRERLWEGVCSIRPKGEDSKVYMEITENKVTYEYRGKRYIGEVIEENERVYKYGREWEVIEEYKPSYEDWIVADFDGIGKVWMNNELGYIVIVERSGKFLRSVF